ncbi:MAG: GMC family oxidoreductase [Myxococcaceae bacterium]
MRKRVLGNEALTHFDALIIGAGAGGGAVAEVLTRRGLNVLVLEAGRNYFDFLDDPTRQPVPAFSNDELKFQVRGMIWPDEKLDPHAWRNSESDGPRTEVGGAVVMPKAVGGAALLADLKTVRFQPQDFKLGTLLKDRWPGTSFTDWPVDYDQLEPFYAYAERMLGVQGLAGADPFEGPRSGPFPMKPGLGMYGSLRVKSGAESLGYHPFPYPGAVTSQPYEGRPPCNDCGFCTSYGCPTNARGTPAVTSIRKALLSGRCLLRAETKVARLLTNATRTEVTGVEAINPDGTRQTFVADRYVLAATAVESARLLWLSGDGSDALGNSSGQVGRNVTFHVHTAALGIWEERLHGHRGRTITHGFSDFRGVANDPDRPLGGIVEISGVSDPIAESGYYRTVLGLLGGGFHPTKFQRLMKQSPGRDRAVALAMIGEDAPQPTNRVDLDPAVKDLHGLPVARITYQSHAFEQAASRVYGPKMVEILVASGAKWAFVAPSEGTPQTSHQHGTLRCGVDAATSVCRPDGRLHDVGNLWAADGSIMNTGSGFNPTLTLVALATRVGCGIVSPGNPDAALS